MRKISILGAGWLGMALAKELLRRGDVKVLASTRNEDRKQELIQFGLDLNVAKPGNKKQSLLHLNLEFYAISVPDISPEDHAFFQTDVLVITLPPGRGRAEVERCYSDEIIATLAHSQKHCFYEVPELFTDHQPRLEVRDVSELKFASLQNRGSIIYTSSTGVYGNATGRVTEATPPAPATASARAVLAAEKLLKDHEIPATILRLAGLFGPDRHPGRWFGGKEKIPNGDAPVNLVHQADVVSAILAVIDQNAWGKIYNVCATDHPTKGNFYAKSAAELGLGIPTSTPGGGDGKWVDNGKLREELGWEPTHKLT